MKYILILRELSAIELETAKSWSDQEGYKIISINDQMSFDGKIQEYIELTQEEKKSINGSVFQDILDFGDTHVGSVPISKFLNIDGAALWYYQKFRIYYKVRNLRYQIDEISKNLLGASSAVIFSDQKNLKATYFPDQKIDLRISDEGGTSGSSIWSIVQYAFAVLCRLVKSMFMPISSLRSKRFVCIDNIGHYREILSLYGDSTVFEHAFLGYMYQKFGDQIGFIDQLLIPKFGGANRYKFNIRHIQNHGNRSRVLGERIMARGLFSLSLIRKLQSARKQLKFRSLQISDTLGQNFKYELIHKEFMALHRTSAFYIYKFLCYQRFFQRWQFPAILTLDENSANYKVILDAAKKQGIFTVGYQHGGISDGHPSYTYSKLDMAQDPDPIPDLTLTWGIKWDNLLINRGNYAASRIKIVGQIRSDVISELENNQSISRDAVLSGIGDKQIVLFASQPQPDASLRLRAAEDVVKACKELGQDSVHLVFKLHPAENDPETYIDIAKKHQLEDYTIADEIDLYVLLKITSIVITCYSTVGTEALFFKKPLIVLDHLKLDLLNYHKDGVAFQATNAQDLVHFMQNIFSEKLKIDSQLLEKYIFASNYQIDGCASDRVWDVLNSVDLL